MIRRRAKTFLLGLQSLCFSGSSRNLSIGKRMSPMTEVQRSVQPLLDRDSLGLHPLFHQIDFPLMDHGGVGIETSLRFKTQHTVEIQLSGYSTMQIGGLAGSTRKRWL